eukprot:scaffold245331_cov48-Attheya_sp.AAC.1
MTRGFNMGVGSHQLHMNVTGTNQYTNGLAGTLPSEIGLLSDLEEIDLGENELTGILSKEARNLKLLHTLRLSNNKLSGPVPTTLSELQDINVFSLANNLLEGTIPINFENVTLDAISFDAVRKVRLRKIDLSNNKLVGTLSPLIGYIATLEHLDLSSNSFTGTIFTTLSILDNLAAKYLHFLPNTLHGFRGSQD